MREIKFRAWDKDAKKIMYFNFVDIYDHRISGLDLFITGIIMQFTGLKDKNGKEIYEGDIIKFVCYTENGNRSKAVGEVLYDIENVCFEIYDKHNEIGLGRNSKEMFLSWAKNIEVIGNIYENPEFLKTR